MKSAVLTFADTNTILTSGQHHACRLANGDVYCWGKNNYGQLGDGTNIDRRHLMRVTTAGTPMEGKAATSITSTENFTCAIADAKLFCWGDNGSGQFGNGSTASSSTPKAAATSLPADALITQASAGDSHVCAVVARTTSPSASEIYCWGNNSDGQLGNGSTGGYVTTAQKVTGIPAGAFVSKVAAKSTIPVPSLTAVPPAGGIICFPYFLWQTWRWQRGNYHVLYSSTSSRYN